MKGSAFKFIFLTRKSERKTRKMGVLADLRRVGVPQRMDVSLLAVCRGMTQKISKIH